MKLDNACGDGVITSGTARLIFYLGVTVLFHCVNYNRKENIK
jgi:hypothetical protein